MASAGFFNDNQHRSFPFLKGTVDLPADGPLTLVNLPDAIIVDIGLVMGQKSGFISGTHSVWLERITRTGDTFYFHFASDAPGLFTDLLSFTRDKDDEQYLTEYAEAGIVAATSISQQECDEPGWWGYLVTGELAELAVLLPSDGTLERGSSSAVVEPALVQNLAGTYVTSFALANADRTRVSAPDDCPEVIWPFTTGVLFIKERCLTGNILFRAGFNMVITQATTEGILTLTPTPGGGAGQPCGEVELFPGEEPPEGSLLLSGGPGCGEILRSLNGQGGRLFDIAGGLGVIVTSLPEENKVLIDVNFSGMALCLQGSES